MLYSQESRDFSHERFKGNLMLKRAYDVVNVTDGKRILVDRIWPRGVKKRYNWICGRSNLHRLKRYVRHLITSLKNFRGLQNNIKKNCSKILLRQNLCSLLSSG
ncbi:hypothetical protein [Enterococcus saccharolyticus]|uniref:DUF488 family protein, N3 subclade n=2 Tax=Enterococcus saccharolyticus TaxID=41997 RepID=UPI003CCBB0AC